MRALILVAGAALAVAAMSACSDDNKYDYNQPVVSNDGGGVVVEYKECQNGQTVPIDAECPASRNPDGSTPDKP